MVETTIRVTSVIFDRATEDGPPPHTGTATFEVPERGLTFQCRFRTESRDRTQAEIAAARNLQILLSWIDEAAETFIAARSPPEPRSDAAAKALTASKDPGRRRPFRFFRR